MHSKRKDYQREALLRSLINASSEIMEQAYQAAMEPEEILDQAEQAVLVIAQTRQKRDFEALKEILYSNLNRIDEVAKDGRRGLRALLRICQPRQVHIRAAEIGPDHPSR